MLHPNALVKTQLGWEFSAEINLEDFIWNHLELLLELKIREKIMNFDERMAEISTSVVTRYS
ncbi:hypothetical protein [Rivularia sp. UHCC 0363]|uniref:hypothetical protein n=1 Tax=Rivularia sp. UHCC 0363 TaxID=3110244 RepID=UPI002B1FA199|nr:hypothetical protein [Rivularia sp. UHCC 0363]MEA5595740.1 hypothetical protein [Rivularia sp. UHCC 0363]